MGARTLWDVGCWAALGLLVVAGCGWEAGKEGSPTKADALRVELAPRPDASTEPDADPYVTRFREAQAELGIDHTYLNGATGQLLMTEAMGGGAGWLDYDGDGRWDLYLNQGVDGTRDLTEADPSGRLFRNEGARFEDVTDLARIAERRYGMGVAVGDYDADGFDDVYLTNVGRNTLYRNQGDGTFRDVTEEAGVGDTRFSSTAAWGDIDLDGDLDLYVCNYADYDPRHPIPCRHADGQPGICHPKDVAPVPDECYLNQGDGTFKPEARERGLFGEGNRALACAIADFTGDDWPDIYVSNDTTENFLFVNQGDGRFVEEAVKRGCAVDRAGARQASMGLGVGDYDHNGWLDIYSTHYYGESNTLYKNLGEGRFSDRTGLEGLHDPTMRRLAFGTVMCDFDEDDHDELIVLNGHVDSENRYYQMQHQLFEFNNRSRGARWTEQSEQAGEFFQQLRVGRGLAIADYDDDGDFDVAAVHQNDPTAVLENVSLRGHWLKCSFVGRGANRRGIGCQVTVESAAGPRKQTLCGGTSYLATNEPSLIFGLGAANQPVDVTVRWPNGAVETRHQVPVDQRIEFDESEANGE